MKVILLNTILFFTVNAEGQLFKNLFYNLEFGSGYSIDKNTYKYYRVNPRFTYDEYVHKRYKFPFLKAKGFFYKKVSAKINAGIATGINVHYLERNYYGQYYTAFSIPVEAAVDYTLIKINKIRELKIEAMFGYNFLNYNFFLFHEKGNFISSIDFLVNKKINNKNVFYYKAGLEFQRDKFSFDYIPFDPLTDSDKPATVGNYVHRTSAFIALGFQL